MYLKLVRSIIITGLLLVGIGFYSINKISYAEEISQIVKGEPRPALMIITLDLKTGKIISVVDEDGNPAESNRGKIENITNTEIAVFHDTHSSPGCRTVCYRGTCYKKCN